MIFNTHIRDGLKLAAERIGLDFWKTDVDFDEQTGQIDKAFFPVIQERLQQNAKDLFPPRERSVA